MKRAEIITAGRNARPGTMLVAARNMDRLIWLAWRALYVTIGACAVLIGQSFWREDAVLAAPAPRDEAPVVVPAAPAEGVGNRAAVRVRDGVSTTSILGWRTVARPTVAPPVTCSVKGARSC